jgi:U3 small nucleolar RNA-associated protein 12
MLGLSAPRFILFHLRLIKGPDLEQALLVLTLDAMRQLLRYLVALLEENVEVELCWRCTIFLLRTHHHQLLHCREMVLTFAKLRGVLKEKLRAQRDGLAINVAGLRLLKREIDEDKNAFVVTPPPATEGGSGGPKKAKTM